MKLQKLEQKQIRKSKQFWQAHPTNVDAVDFLMPFSDV